MKSFTLIFLSLFIYSVGRSQGTVTDTHPLSQIFVINYQSGQEVQASGDDAILFKDAFIDLVRNTDISRQILSAAPGRKVAVVKQIDPQKLNGYQLTWLSVQEQNRALCTFYYNIDQNALYFYDQNQRNWAPVNIDDNNMNNLNNCQAYCKFNSNSGGLPDLSVSNAPVSDDVATQEDVSANTAPPELPEYQQPPCPTDGYLWQPGYWAYSLNARDYYWVPGVWVAPPNPGLYWTPCYWGYAGNAYVFHRGYWGPSVGFYGGINYGYGYVGVGYVGGVWHGREFSYNTAVVRVNTTVIHNTYVNNTVVNNTTVVNRTSFNGRGGVAATPTPQEQAAARQPHVNPTAAQVTHQQEVATNKSQFASVNKGRPAVTSVAKVAPAAQKNSNPATPNNNRTPGNQTNNTPGFGGRANANPNAGSNNPQTPNVSRTPQNQPNPNIGDNKATPNTNGTNPQTPNINRTPQNQPNPNIVDNKATPNTKGTNPQTPNINRTPQNQPNPNVGGNRNNPNTNNNNPPAPDLNKTPTNPPTPNMNRTPGNQNNATPNNKPANNNAPANAPQQQRQPRQDRQPRQQQPKQQQQTKPREKQNN